jgi:hypothetical protein
MYVVVKCHKDNNNTVIVDGEVGTWGDYSSLSLRQKCKIKDEELFYAYMEKVDQTYYPKDKISFISISSCFEETDLAKLLLSRPNILDSRVN